MNTHSTCGKPLTCQKLLNAEYVHSYAGCLLVILAHTLALLSVVLRGVAVSVGLMTFLQIGPQSATIASCSSRGLFALLSA